MKKILQILETENLASLSDNEYLYKDLNVLLFSGSKKRSSLNNFKKFNNIKNEWDLINCNNDLKILTAHLYFYRPLINNPLKESYPLDGEFMSTYFQNGSDWFYSTFVSCCFEKLYNFWDRIGDALAFYLDLSLPEFQVNFSKTIDLINALEEFSQNKYFLKLLNFKNNDFLEFNRFRKEIVHYYQFETTYRYEHLMNNRDKNEIEKLWNWKKNMPEYFKNHIIESCEGYYNAYKFINNLP